MDGDYKYRYLNGDDFDEGIRRNNAYEDLYFGVSSGVKVSNYGELRVGYKQQEINQQLPGAVILYNNTADESLFTNDYKLFADWKYSNSQGKFGYRVYGSVNRNEMRYLDPTYLNSQGKIDRIYQNDVVNLGISGRSRFNLPFTFTYGFEQVVARLSTSDFSLGKPLRYHSLGIIGVNRKHRKLGTFNASVSGQFISDNVGGEKVTRLGITPLLSYQTKKFGSMNFVHSVWYKNSFRMPSFNELYYNQIGNKELEPEIANQLNYQLSFVPVKDNCVLLVRMNGYYNKIKDKIVAIPTQNLFVWSIQNVGEVDIWGGDVSFTFSKKWTESWQLFITSNYNFQHAIDVTDKESPTYGDQIAYIPKHSGNFDVHVSFNQFGMQIGNFMSSKRYALNQNISANEVPGFVISDVALYYFFGKEKFEGKHQLKAQFTIKNVFNSSYAYIRSYIMPGRNYLITLSYEIK